MEKWNTILIFAILVFIVANSSNAADDWTIDGGNESIESGDVYNSVFVNGSSDVDVYGGSIQWLKMSDTSILSVYNGSIDELTVLDNSSVFLHGGTIPSIGTSQLVKFEDDIEIEIFCKSYNWNESTNLITGVWANNSTFNIELNDNIWEDYTTYKMIDQVSFTIVPEPMSVILLGIGGLLVSRRQLN